jgi:small conductance mechanosensitive channel
MESISQLVENVRPLLPALVVAVAAVLAVVAIRLVLDRLRGKRVETQYPRQLAITGLVLIAVFVLLLVVPISDTMRGQLLGLIGILLSAALALSSTTFIGNALAGLMLRAIRNFRPGDFIRVGDHYGRVSERGLFHTEIQTEDRDLTTLPNLYLVSHPVRVVRSTGTLLSATVSLGYDIPHTEVEAALLDAAQRAGLAEPFVSVLGLGDYSVEYRIAGLLTEVKEILSARSRLHAEMLDCLHGAGIEIVSPSFTNARLIRGVEPVIPETPSEAPPQATPPPKPESLVFDKAEEAASLEKLRQSLAELDESIGAAQKDLKNAGEDQKARLQDRLDALNSRRDALVDLIKRREKELNA